jgi:hypothetical protein
MHTPTTQKKLSRTIKLAPLDPSKVKRGHQEHRSGAGTHQDRRTKRLRTRSAQKRFALSDN